VREPGERELLLVGGARIETRAEPLEQEMTTEIPISGRAT
jgi:hypothetical protein